MTGYTCPRCGAVSHNPHDADERYCARCHTFNGDEFDALAMWTIYDHPSDYPTCFIARKWLVRNTVHRTDTTMQADRVEMLRAAFEGLGLVCMWRAPADDPNIVETWF